MWGHLRLKHQSSQHEEEHAQKTKDFRPCLFGSPSSGEQAADGYSGSTNTYLLSASLLTTRHVTPTPARRRHTREARKVVPKVAKRRIGPPSLRPDAEVGLVADEGAAVEGDPVRELLVREDNVACLTKRTVSGGEYNCRVANVTSNKRPRWLDSREGLYPAEPVLGRRGPR